MIAAIRASCAVSMVRASSRAHPGKPIAAVSPQGHRVVSPGATHCSGWQSQSGGDDPSTKAHWECGDHSGDKVAAPGGKVAPDIAEHKGSAGGGRAPGGGRDADNGTEQLLAAVGPSSDTADIANHSFRRCDRVQLYLLRRRSRNLRDRRTQPHLRHRRRGGCDIICPLRPTAPAIKSRCQAWVNNAEVLSTFFSYRERNQKRPNFLRSEN